MARVYKTSDKISYKIGELEIKISPLSVNDKQEASALMLKGQAKADIKAMIEASLFMLQCGVKDVTGLENFDGSPYKLSFDDSGKLTRECAEELLNIEQSNKLIELCSAFINGVPSNLPEGISLAVNPK